MKQKEIIEKIRRIRFGIGLDTANLTGDIKEALKDKEKILADASKLAREIHTKKPHFIFELIQNAEDNKYRNDKPTIKFIIGKDRLIIQNNEEGFCEENAKALCGIGGSTKKNKSGYIGEKGIGFKSVFMIANKVHIYSNGYQFGFNYNEDKPETMIIPQWIDEVPESVDLKQTNIILYINPETKNSLIKYFEEIHPSILLFLRKLKVIEIVEKEKNKIKTMELRNKDGITEVVYGKAKSYWKVIKKSFDVPEEIYEERRENIKETEIILAFPLKEDFYPDTSKEQTVFAFLPIRNYGFKFIIQADFLLPVTREDIIKDNDWNIWLRNSISDVFLYAVNEFKNDEKLKYSFYDYLPFEEIKDEFFLPVVEQIYEKLKKEECILTEANVWKKPSDVLFGDKEIRKVITNEDLQNLLGKEYLSDKVKAKKPVFDKLGIQEFSINDLLECLKKTKWVKKQSDEWFANLFGYLSEKKLSKKQIEQLKDISILRLEDGTMTSINEGIVFSQLKKEMKSEEKMIYYGFEKELRILKKEISYAILRQEKEKKNKTIEFLRTLGLKQADPYEIIENHILPIYESENWKQKDAEVLTGYIRYIKDNIDRYEKEKDKRLNANKESWESKEDPLERLKKSLLIRIDKNDDNTEWYDNPENIYLSKKYGNKNNLEELFEGIEVNFVHPCYIESDMQPIKEKISKLEKKLKGVSKKHRKKHRRQIGQLKEEINKKVAEWKEFFLKIGLWETIMVKMDPETEIKDGHQYAKNEVTKKAITEKENTIWKDEDWYSTDWMYYIENDWISPDLESVFDNMNKMNKTKAITVSKHLFTTIYNHWDIYKDKLQTKYYYRYSGQQGWSYDYTKSTFHLLLLNNAWLPTTQNTLARPPEIFLDKPEIHKVLGNTVPYLVIKIQNDDLIKQLDDDESFIRKLEINAQANTESVLNYLVFLTERKNKDKERFETLYKFLDAHFNDDAEKIKEVFDQHSLIFIPDSENNYYKANEVVWKNLEDIFGKNEVYLEKYYPKLKEFFVKKIGVNEKPTPKNYADVLCNISNKENVTDEDKKVIIRIYEELNKNLNPNRMENPISREDWWEDFVKKVGFLTDRDEFWLNEGDVFINDNSDIYEIFKDEARIGFLWLPRDYNPDKIKYFIECAHLRYLSEDVEVKPLLDEGISSSKNSRYTELIQKTIPYVLRYLYWKDYEEYETLKKNEFGRIATISVYETENLKVQYSIKINDWQAIQKESEKEECIYYSEENRIYVKSDCNLYNLAVESSKVFGKIEGLDDFVMNIMTNISNAEAILKAKNIKDLPDAEKEDLLRQFKSVEAEKEELEKKELKGNIVRNTEDAEEKPLKPKSYTNTERVNTGIGKDAWRQQRSSSEKLISIANDKNTSKEAIKESWEPEIPPEDAPIRIEEFDNFQEKIKSKGITKNSQRLSTEKSVSENEVISNNTDHVVGDLSEKDKIKIGQWGEKYALENIKSKMQKKYPEANVEDTSQGFKLKRGNEVIVEAVWLNKYGESGQHYDIKIIENGNEIYIEVKSTKERDKSWFRVSKDEWKLMKEKGNNFYIYRVYSAGTEEAGIKTIHDPVKQWKEGKINAYPMGIEI